MMKRKVYLSPFSSSLLSVGLSILFSRFHNLNAMYEGNECSDGEFMVLSGNADSFVRCQSCYMCPPGYGVTRECSLTTDTVCARCPEGYFSDSSTREGGCQKCKPCMDMADTMQQCTPNSDRVCHKKCTRGEYLDVPNRRCMPCSLCHSENDVRVSENYQCLSQGMPRDWSCETNITVVDESGGIIDTFDTGDTYSFKAITLRRQNRDYTGNLIPPLADYIRHRLMPRITSTTRTSTTTFEPAPISNTEPITVLTTRQSNMMDTFMSVSTIAHTLPSFRTTESLIDSVTQCDDGNWNATVYWIVSFTYVFLILLITLMGLRLYDYRKDYIATHCGHSEMRQLSKRPTPMCTQTLPTSLASAHYCGYSQPPPYDKMDLKQDQMRTYFIDRIVTPV